MKRSQNRIPYTYLIGWSKQNMWYYGRRTALNCNPSELWNTYFTSSNSVKKFRIKHGEPDIIQIRKVFITIDKARDWEDKVLRRMNVVKNSKFLNRRNGDKSNLFNTSNTALAKIKNTNQKLGPIDIDDPRWTTGEIVGICFGLKRSNETKEKCSAAKKNKTQARNTKTGLAELVLLDDPRWATGEIVGINKGRNLPQDKEHVRKRMQSRKQNNVQISEHTRAHFSETRKGKKPAYNIDGEFLELISTIDPRWGFTIFSKHQLKNITS